MLIQCDKFYQSGGENHYTEWKHYLGDPGRSHYSELSEFTSKNIKSLKVAWEYEINFLASNLSASVPPKIYENNATVP